MLRRQVAAVAVSALFLFPLAYLTLGALRAPGVLPNGLDIVPTEPSLDSFSRAFDLVPLGNELVNSAIVAAIAVPLTVVTASWAGFAMTRLAPRQRSLVLGASLIVLMIPLSALWVPRFVIFRELSLIDTYVPLVAPALLGTTPFYVLLYYWSYRRIPVDLIDAARLEGLGPLAIWWRIGSPLVRPTTFAVGALAFVFYWGNFIDPLLYLLTPDNWTLPLGLYSLKQLGPNDLSVLLAGSLFATVPAVVVFALVQGRLLRGTRQAGWLGR